MLAYQDIPENLSGLTTELSRNNSIAELMGIVFVLLALGFVMFLIYLIAKLFRFPNKDQVDDTPSEKWLTLVKDVMNQKEELKAIFANQNKFATLLERMIESQKTGASASGEQHVEFLQLLERMQSIQQETNQGLTRAVTTMNDNLDEFTIKLEELIAKWDAGITLSPETQQEVVNSISSKVSTEMKLDIAGNHNELMKIIKAEFNRLKPPETPLSEDETEEE